MIKYLIIIFFFSANAFSAIKPEIYIGGKVNFSAGRVDQNPLYEQDELPRRTGVNGNETEDNTLNKDNYFAQDTYIDFVVVGKTDNATLYGGRAVIELDSQRQQAFRYTSVNGTATSDNNDLGREEGNNTRSVITRRAYGFLEKKTLGRFEFGDVEGVSKKMKFDAAYRVGGTGGIAGNWWKFVNIPDFGLTYDSELEDNASENGTESDPFTCSNYARNDIRYCGTGAGNSVGTGNKSFIIRPDLPLSHGYSRVDGADKFDDTRTIARISYFSPRVSGMQIGLSYAPDSGDRGSSYYGQGLSGENSGDAFDIFDWGINYVEQFDDVGVAFSITGEIGYSEDNDEDSRGNFVQQDLNSYAIGGYVFFGNLSLSGSVGEWNNSLMTVREDIAVGSSQYRADEANYITAGIGYEFGPYKFNISNLTSTYREQEFSLISASFDYRVSKSFAFYAESNAYDFKVFAADRTREAANIGQSLDNSGTVFLVGAKLKFGGISALSQISLDTSADSY